jgi:hypothetical protein
MTKLLKAYLFGIAIAVCTVVFSYPISLASKITSDELAVPILLNTLQLDGLLFGFSAVMFGLVFTKEGTRVLKEKENVFRIAVMEFSSFSCYIFSLVIDISLLSKPEERYLALFPLGVALWGVMISSLYMVALFLLEPLSD